MLGLQVIERGLKFGTFLRELLLLGVAFDKALSERFLRRSQFILRALVLGMERIKLQLQRVGGG